MGQNPVVDKCINSGSQTAQIFIPVLPLRYHLVQITYLYHSISSSVKQRIVVSPNTFEDMDRATWYTGRTI